MPKNKNKAEREIERMAASGYQWPKPIRRSFYVYPVQITMMDEICQAWKTTRREVFMSAIQFYIHDYLRWKEGGDEKK